MREIELNNKKYQIIGQRYETGKNSLCYHIYLDNDFFLKITENKETILNLPHFPKVVEEGIINDQYYVIYQYVDGKLLKEVDNISRDLVISLFEAILDIKKMGYLIFDVNPTNFIINEVVNILDYPSLVSINKKDLQLNDYVKNVMNKEFFDEEVMLYFVAVMLDECKGEKDAFINLLIQDIVKRKFATVEEVISYLKAK